MTECANLWGDRAARLRPSGIFTNLNSLEVLVTALFGTPVSYAEIWLRTRTKSTQAETLQMDSGEKSSFIWETVYLLGTVHLSSDL